MAWFKERDDLLALAAADLATLPEAPQVVRPELQSCPALRAFDGHLRHDLVEGCFGNVTALVAVLGCRPEEKPGRQPEIGDGIARLEIRCNGLEQGPNNVKGMDEHERQ